MRTKIYTHLRQRQPNSGGPHAAGILFISFFLMSLVGYGIARAQAAEPPEPIADSVTTDEDTPILIDVLANDLPEDDVSLVIVAVGEPQSGTATITDGQILYTPDTDFSGSDSFFYSIHNGDTANTRQTTVSVTVEEVDDGPLDISLDNDTIAEDTEVEEVIGRLSASFEGPHSFLAFLGLRFSLVDGDNDNDKFRIIRRRLSLQSELDFETQETYIVDVRARNLFGKTVVRRFVIKVTNVNDAPHALTLSNDRIDENQPAGVVVGTFSTEDNDSSDTHTYTLAAGVGSDDNRKFRIDGETLLTDELLDFEAKPIYSIRIATTDDNGGTFEQIFLIHVNNIPSPPDAVAEPLSFCTGNPITLVEEGFGNELVLVEIDDIAVSDKSATGCNVTGQMSITSNGSTVNDLPFSGTVNERNQFSETSIPDFTIGVAGLPLLARDVEISYSNERPSLHITRPELQMPREFGGLSALVTVPTFIDTGGIRIGEGQINLPTIVTDSGFEMNLTGVIQQRGNGFQIDADGSLSMPNIGKKKTSGSEGQDCEISAGVTIFADAQNRTVMTIAAGDELPNAGQDAFGQTAVFSPEAVDALRLEKIRAGLNCSPGLPIAQTGLFLTGLSGEITLIPGEERVDVEVNIEAGKSIPGLGPVLALDGTMGLQPRPFELDLGVALQVLSVKVAQADARITTESFRASISFQALFINGSATINAFTHNGRATFTGSARLSLEVKKGSIVPGKRCRFIRVRLCPPPFPPFSSGKIGSIGADVGEFTNGNFGFKGFVKFFGTHGFFVDHKGKFTFRNVNRFQLIPSPTIKAAKEAWLKAADDGDTASRAHIESQYTFLEDVDGIVGNDGVIVAAPLTKPAVDASRMAIAPTDVISQVNLIQHGDVIFNLFSDTPLAFTLMTPQGQEVTPDNFDQSETVGYGIEYYHLTQYELVTDSDTEVEEVLGPQLLFTPLSAEEAVNGVDLRIDGTIVYFDLDFQNSHEWLDAFPLTAGEHLIELVENGTNNVVRSTTVNLVDDSQVSVVSVGGSVPGFVTIADDTSAPSEFGKTKIRFFNGTDSTLSLFVDGAPLLTDVAYKGVSDFAEIDAGTKEITLRNSGDAVVAELSAAELADGGVYTFMSTDFNDGVHDITLIQREDALYQPTYLTYYSVDQAEMNQTWDMKVVGDTDNSFYQLSVMGPDSPPILGSVTVEASKPAEAEVSWQLTSDNNPTLISIYANPGEISATLPLTAENGTVDWQEIPLYEGTLIAEFEVSDLAELGGQLVTKQIDLSVLPSGTYHLWVRADDGLNPAVETYAELPTVARSGEKSVYGTNAVWFAKDDFNPMARISTAAEIVIDHSADFPTEWAATVDTSFDAEEQSLYIEWQAQSHPDTDLYRLHFGHTPLNPTKVITVGNSIQEFDEDGLATGAEVGFVTLQDIQPGVTYYFSIEGVDMNTGRSVRSPEFTFLVEPGSFTILSSQALVNIAAGSSAQVPVTLNVEEALFFPNVWLSTDLGGAPLGITARFVDDLDGMTNINPANPTHNLEISVDASVPHGMYPIEIAGYNGDVEENLTIQVIVSEDGGSAATLYLPLVTR